VEQFDAIVIGAGVVRLYQLYRLRKLGLSVRLYEDGSGVGGTNVTMFEPVRTAISALQAKNRLRTRFVFANQDGSPLNVRWQDDNPWRRALERAGLEYRVYTFSVTRTHC